MRAKRQARQSEAGRTDALLLMIVTELTSQLDRSELKEEAPLNTAREEMGQSEEAASRREAGRRDALVCMLVTELTSQLDRSELKEEAWKNTARDEIGESEQEHAHSASQRQAGRRDALYRMLVTELTSQLDRSELKEEAPVNTAREEWVRATRRTRQGRLGGETHSAPCW